MLDLAGEKASQQIFESYIRKNNPGLIFFNGHGNDKVVCGHNDETLVAVGVNETLLQKRIIYARSCDCAKVLGRKAIQAGTITFIGYQGKFVFIHLTNLVAHPLNDHLARLFLAPSNLIPTALIKGNRATDAYQKSQKAMYRNLIFTLSTKASDEERYAAPFLLSNIRNQILLGSGEAVL